MSAAFRKEPVGASATRESALAMLLKTPPARRSGAGGDDDGGSGVVVDLRKQLMLTGDDDGEEVGVREEEAEGPEGPEAGVRGGEDEEKKPASPPPGRPKQPPRPISKFMPFVATVHCSLRRGEPFSVRVNEDAVIMQLIELLLPGAPHEVRARATLRVANEKGEIDEDFPTFDREVPLSMLNQTNFFLDLDPEEEKEDGVSADMLPPTSALAIGDESSLSLLQKHADLRFFYAAENGDLAEVRRLVSSRQIRDVNISGIDSFTALHFAARSGRNNVVKYLLKHPGLADVDPQTKAGWTPLHLAVHQGHLDVAELLLLCGANPLTRTKSGSSAAELARRDNRPDNKKIVELLEEFVEESRGDDEEAAAEAEAGVGG